MPMRHEIEQNITENTLETYISSFDIKNIKGNKPKKLVLKKKNLNMIPGIS